MSETLKSDQARIRHSMLGAAILIVVWMIAGLWLWPFDTSYYGAPGARLGYALSWDFWAAIMLLLGVLKLARDRFFAEGAIAGGVASDPATNARLEIDRRYLRNTVEQTVLLFIGHLTFAFACRTEELIAIPLLVGIFIIGRIAFWVGYHRSPPARAFGFATTFWPIIGLYLFTAYRLIVA